MNTKTNPTRAIVAHDALANNGWKLEDVVVRSPSRGELLVEMVGSGICHSDLLFGGLPKDAGPGAMYPRVLGHEGSGYVREIGPDVSQAKVGDAVLLSFDSCQKCNICASKYDPYCPDFDSLNFTGEWPVFSTMAQVNSKDKGDVPNTFGLFFGQSSFANLSIVSENSVVNVNSLMKSKEELQLLSPLGCGIQTGAGAVINIAKAGPEDIVLIMGLGGVGLAALVAAAHISKCKKIIGVDKVASRLELARELGATEIIDTDNIPEGKSLEDRVKMLTDGVGPTITFESTGVPALIKAGFAMTRRGGKYIQIGTAPPDFTMEIPWFEFMRTGKQIYGSIEGQARPSEFIPQMIEWYREGRFPIDKLMKVLPVENWQDAVKGMKDGSIIKPIITWS